MRDDPDGQWKAWTTRGTWPEDSTAPEGTTHAGVSPDVVVDVRAERFFAAAGMTVFAHGREDLVEVPLDGAPRPHDLGPSLRVLQSLAWDESTKSLLLLTGGAEWIPFGQRGPEFPLELTELGGAREPPGGSPAREG